MYVTRLLGRSTTSSLRADMMVTCVGKSLRDLPPNPVAYNQEAVTRLTVKMQYQVCAMSLYAGSIMVLVCDDTGLPNWYPMQLFRVSDSNVPGGWRFASYGDSAHLQALWGYGELVDDESHYNDILERKNEALEVLFTRCRQRRER
jgi:hypothetical protein